ncbi:hypothetical protein M408DRAFT_32674, partial [Serendipita vermifera MAFF 305830]
NEAGSAHSEELSKLRAESQATMEQVRTAHANSLQQLEASHKEAQETSLKSFEKQLASITLELKATQDDLARSKASVTTSQTQIDTQLVEIQRLTQECEAAKTSASSNSEKDTQIEGLKRQLSSMADDLEATKMASDAQKESLQEMTDSHQRDLQEAAKSRVE